MSEAEIKLTPKQEGFAQAYIETGNATEAYRRFYSVENMSDSSVNREAKQLLDHLKISSRIAQLRQLTVKRHMLTVDDLLAELEEARQLALATNSAAPAVGATMGKAKILGMDKQIVDHQSSDGSMTPSVAVTIDAATVKDIASKLNDDC